MHRINRYHVNGFLFALSLWLCLLLTSAWGATSVACGPGDTACLIAAIDTANASGEETTITLAAGTYPLTAPAAPSTGLPLITGTIAITGAGTDVTTIARDPAPTTPSFRLFQVAPTGTLTLTALTLTGGNVRLGATGAGGAILNAGTLTLRDTLLSRNEAEAGGAVGSHGTTTIARSRLTRNNAQFFGGAIYVDGGDLTMDHSTLDSNFAQGLGGALANGFFMTPASSAVVITNSAIVRNTSDFTGALYNTGTLDITSTTFAFNQTEARQFGRSTVLHNEGGTTTLHNCTISGNASVFFGLPAIPALRNTAGVLSVANTILALNSEGTTPGGTCAGVLTSLDANIFGDLLGCTVTLQPDDQTGDPLLDNLADDGTPGNAHWPLIAGSPAINAAHDLGCPAQDQLGHARLGTCDIGAVEFQPPAVRKRLKSTTRVATR
jgi:hypothetical protein